jgi:ribonuclease-3
MLFWDNKIREFLDKINIDNINEELMSEALTHPSFNYEKNIENAPNYERLEFLGDSVLRLSLSSYLYDKYPLDNEIYDILLY